MSIAQCPYKLVPSEGIIMSVLSPDQKLLARYLAELNMPRASRVLIVAELWEPEATMEMLCYIADTQETDHKKLSEVACKIARKYNDNEE